MQSKDKALPSGSPAPPLLPACPTPCPSSSWPPGLPWQTRDFSPPNPVVQRLFFFFFLCGPFLKAFIEFVTILLLFYVWFSGHKTCAILVTQPGIEPALPALEGGVLATGPPGKSHIQRFLAPAWPSVVLLSLPVPSSPKMS